MNNCDWEETKGLVIEKLKVLLEDGLPWDYVPWSIYTNPTFTRADFRVSQVGDHVVLSYYFNEIDRSPWTLQVWGELSERRAKAEQQAKCERVLALLSRPTPAPEPAPEHNPVHTLVPLRAWWRFW